jgi:segregation and condensation protein A
MAAAGISQLAISLPRYEGPFDLLLALIRRNEYPIDALPVAEITGQFLAYVRSGPELDPELAGEFVEVASWLVLLKSRSMLPAGIDEGPAPHEELRRAVLDHETLRAATEFLQAREGRSRPGAAGARPGRPEAAPVVVDAELPTVFDLVEAARKALEAARAARSIEDVEAGIVTVEEMIRWIQVQLTLRPAGESVSTREWFREQPGSTAPLFLGLLEMASKGALLLHQEEDFGEIHVKAARGDEEDSRSLKSKATVAIG